MVYRPSRRTSAGFGAYVERHIPDNREQGVLVLKRASRGFDQCSEDLAQYLFDFVQMSRRQRIEVRNRAERLSEMFDWSVLVKHYQEAHDLALERTSGAQPGKIEVRMV